MSRNLPCAIPGRGINFVPGHNLLDLPRVTVQDAFTFAVVLSIILAPLRFGFSEAFRPTTVILLPSAALLLVTNLSIIGDFIRTRMGLAFGGLMLLLILGHTLGNDIMEAYEGDDYSVLALESLIGLPIAFICGAIIGRGDHGRIGATAALGIGLAVHIASIAIFPPAVEYRGHDRMAGLLSDPNILLLHIIPIFFLWQASLNSKTGIAFAQLMLPPVIWATLQTLSRAGLVALSVGLAIQFLSLLVFSKSLKERFWIIGLTLGISVLVLASSQHFPDFVQERIDAHVARSLERMQSGGSLVADRMLWLNEIHNHTLSDHLLHPFGMGYRRFQSGNATLPHNTFADIYITGGPLALLLAASLFVGAFLAFVKFIGVRARQSAFRAQTVGLIACIVTELLLLSSLSVLSGKINWLVLGILLGFADFLRNRNSPV